MKTKDKISVHQGLITWSRMVEHGVKHYNLCLDHTRYFKWFDPKKYSMITIGNSNVILIKLEDNSPFTNNLSEFGGNGVRVSNLIEVYLFLVVVLDNLVFDSYTYSCYIHQSVYWSQEICKNLLLSLIAFRQWNSQMNFQHLLLFFYFYFFLISPSTIWKSA